ncbi:MULTISPECIES: alpha/beta hydrolase [Mycobacterium]|nr:MULTISPECIES: alpha/beta hydrolase [Mycobacterium]MDP7732208.1 alpha/beta hydrolase [Mycobacterium sp. TY813]
MDAATDATRTEVAQRMSAAFAGMADGSADAVEVRDSLRASRRPPSHVAVARTENRTIPGPGGRIPVRVYHPSQPDPSGTPLMVYLHGGGFVLCDLDSHDACCRRLANGAGAIVVSVDYRLAPENPFPAALDDAWAATRWVSAHGTSLGGDPGRLIVAGDSAGGNLATVVCMLARDSGGPPIALQLLIYPVLDQRRKPSAAQRRAAPGVLTLEHMRWFTEQYLGSGGDPADARVSPILGELAGLPAAHIVTGELDPHCDDNEDYARRLRAAGVNATVQVYAGMFHGFFNLPDDIPIAEQAYADACLTLRETLNRPEES